MNLTEQMLARAIDSITESSSSSAAAGRSAIDKFKGLTFNYASNVTMKAMLDKIEAALDKMDVEVAPKSWVLRHDDRAPPEYSLTFTIVDPDDTGGSSYNGSFEPRKASSVIDGLINSRGSTDIGKAYKGANGNWRFDVDVYVGIRDEDMESK